LVEPKVEPMQQFAMSEAELQLPQIAEPLPEKNTFIDYPPTPMARPATPTSTAPAFFKRFQNPILLGSNHDDAYGGACASSYVHTVDKISCSTEIENTDSTPSTCEHCGNLFLSDANFCRKCGEPRLGHSDHDPSLGISRSIGCHPHSPQSEQQSAEEAVGLPSVGSAEHQLGTCSPCAWYWKPGGCKNGKGCTHCHLCLSGTRKAMKKAKVMKLRAQDAAGHQLTGPTYVAYGCESPSPSPLVSTASALPSLSETMALFDEKEGEFMNIAPVKVQVKNTFIQIEADSSPKFSLEAPASSAPGDFFRRCFQTRQTQEAGHSSPTSPPMPAASPDVVAQCPVQSSLNRIQDASNETEQIADRTMPQMFPADAVTGGGMTGIQAHALGQCTPCAYFWYKKDGCRLEVECKFCHLCQKGEIKKRKKHRIQHLKAVGAFIPGYAKMQQDMHQALPSCSQSPQR